VAGKLQDKKNERGLMPIYFDKASSTVVRAAAARLGSRTSERVRGVRQELRVAPPVAVYAIRPGQDSDEFLPSQARRIAWRCFALSGDEAVAAADVKRKAGRWMVSSFTSGMTVKRAVEAIASAEKEAGERELRVRLLVAPWLFFNAVWMSGGGEHRLVIIDAPGTDLPRYVSKDDARSFDWETVAVRVAHFARARRAAARAIRTFDSP
jgi:hypothetical protein